MSVNVEERPVILQTLDKLVDLMIGRIVAFSDYFILEKRVTLSETTVFALSLTWLLWFVFGGTFYETDTPLSRLTWVLVFATTTVTHFTGFFFKTVIARAYVMCFHAFVWGFLCILALQTLSSPPAFPTLFVFTILSSMLAVRLFREGKA